MGFSARAKSNALSVRTKDAQKHVVLCPRSGELEIRIRLSVISQIFFRFEFGFSTLVMAVLIIVLLLSAVVRNLAR